MNTRRTFLAQLAAAGSASLLNLPAAKCQTPEPAASSLPRWWPRQAMPKGVVRAKAEAPSPALAFLLQSLSGLAAQAVNEGRSDQLVWIDTPQAAYRRWFQRTIEQTGIADLGEVDAWDLLARMKDQGLVQGYVLCRLDDSVNVATTLCGVLQGVLIDESLEAKARELGLTRLADAREMSLSDCFAAHQDQLNRQMILAQDPSKPLMRELAIAHRCIALYGQSEPVPHILAWLDPLSTVLGWNGGEEWVQVKQFSEFGHVLTVSDWALGLPLLSVDLPGSGVPKIGGLDPRTIDWNWEGACTSLVMSDGDNVQWALGGFTSSPQQPYWDNPANGEFPFSWTAPVVPLSQTAPVAAEYLASTRPPNVSLVEFGGGYIFPDFFGTKRDETDLLDRYAARLAPWMEATDTRVLCLLLLDLDSPAAARAYETFARHMPQLTGIIAMQYAPYEGGAGKVFWVNDGQGGELPVMTCRYAVWEHADRPNAGTPSQVAKLASCELPPAVDPEQRLAWTVVHAWSWFREGNLPAQEEVRQRGAERKGAQRGMAVAKWCEQKLTDDVRAVTIEELLWRLRMAHDPQGTTQRLSP
ncbi:GxGYxYP domain-containing protein [Blastopirellula marina]|uniref:Uncharacterized protein n=1 Tax=Blastopirellula marina TaxID=124 RepID=A0A2S8GM58_9BACT|nr:GxGYxYP domain-containing protein [Blastopirellula marina]PQO45522.1 hypothetical protein C5Y93_13825 [Blastopirellula marina]